MLINEIGGFYLWRKLTMKKTFRY